MKILFFLLLLPIPIYTFLYAYQLARIKNYLGFCGTAMLALTSLAVPGYMIFFR